MSSRPDIKPTVPTRHILARDPNTNCRLNANSFQQDAVTSHHGWQYCAYYTSGTAEISAPRYITIARRNLSPAIPDSNAIVAVPTDSAYKPNTTTWETLTLRDYAQTIDDGHNTVSLGICPGDGTIHLSFDHHCDQLRFRISQPKVATNPCQFTWSTDLFSPVTYTLPGISANPLLQQITYPRFIPTGLTLTFECRVGMAGEGSDIISVYDPEQRAYSQPLVYLQGIRNNPYIHGLSYDEVRSRLHVSWTYREFVEYDTSTEVHKQQAGPNGPTNNRDLAYLYSNDHGLTWRSTNDEVVGTTESPIRPEAPEIVVYNIPCNSGILNQEGQCVDADGNFHVLTRDTTRVGVYEWRHITRNAKTGTWNSKEVPILRPTAMGSRGSVCCDPRTGSVYFLIPGNETGDDSLRLLRRKLSRSRTDTAGNQEESTEIGTELFLNYETLWDGKGFDGEPLYDEQLLRGGSQILSVFTRTSGEEKFVVLLDFQL